jgi:hypothetical protein
MVKIFKIFATTMKFNENVLPKKPMVSEILDVIPTTTSKCSEKFEKIAIPIPGAKKIFIPIPGAKKYLFRFQEPKNIDSNSWSQKNIYSDSRTLKIPIQIPRIGIGVTLLPVSEQIDHCLLLIVKSSFT